MATIVLDSKRARYTARAIETLATHWGLTCKSSGSVDAGETTIGILFWFGEPAELFFFEDFSRQWESGVRRFVLFSPELGDRRPWDGLPAGYQAAFADRVTLCPSPGADALQRALKKAQENGHKASEWAAVRLNEIIEARAVYSAVVRRFSHSSGADVSNQFLAPARLLLLDRTIAAEQAIKGSRPDWHRIWLEDSGGGFDGALHRAGLKGTLISELIDSSTRLADWLKGESAAISPGDVSRTMALLTACRVASGEHTNASDVGSPGEGVSPIRLDSVLGRVRQVGEPFKIVVVDDDAKAWRCVFQRLQERLQTRTCEVEFWFSADARTVATSDYASPQTRPLSFDEYDLVVLDVFLRQKRSGLELLREVRRDFPNLPVLLWTTSRDEELAAEACLANGIILKKTVQWESLEDSVLSWVREGRSKGSRSLASPYFNHVIHKEEHRSVAVAVFDWCLKQLDSFHALDGSYFRYFTDHGGRHVVRLLELLEQALRPFAGRADNRVLAPEPDAREFELLALYLAVVCHELGMFPLKSHGTVEEFGRMPPEYLDDVRSLHALRGMALLHPPLPWARGGSSPVAGSNGPAKPRADYWSDADGTSLGEKLRELNHPEGASADKPVSLSDLLAVLVGYHARCLESLAEADFLKWPSDVPRFSKLKSASATLAESDAIYWRTLTELEEAFKDHTAVKERLRNQCALFRFVDAIDVSSSRNPALFLIHHRDRNAANNREYLKRQICREVSIGRSGDLAVSVRAEAPGKDVIVAALGTLIAVEPSTLTGGVAELKKVLEDMASLDSDFAAKPWDEHEGARKLPVNLQKCLDAWLRLTWAAIIKPEFASRRLIDHLDEVGVWDKGADRITDDGRKLIAGMTALSMAGEILDEYRAITETGLDDVLRLGSFNYEGWEANQTETTVTILGEGLRQYRVGQPI